MDEKCIVQLRSEFSRIWYSELNKTKRILNCTWAEARDFHYEEKLSLYPDMTKSDYNRIICSRAIVKSKRKKIKRGYNKRLPEVQPIPAKVVETPIGSTISSKIDKFFCDSRVMRIQMEIETESLHLERLNVELLSTQNNIVVSQDKLKELNIILNYLKQEQSIMLETTKEAKK